MKVTLTIVPPGGGEGEFTLDFDMPGIPQQGDYISVYRPGQMGTEDYIVRRTWWVLDFPSTEAIQPEGNVTVGTTKSFYVECEIARGIFSSEEHSRTCDAYESSGKLRSFDESGY